MENKRLPWEQRFAMANLWSSEAKLELAETFPFDIFNKLIKFWWKQQEEGGGIEQQWLYSNTRSFGWWWKG